LLLGFIIEGVTEGGSMRKAKAIVIDPKDNVATVIGTLQAGDTVTARIDSRDITIEARDAIPFAHKIAIRPIARGEDVLKYGCSIGKATADIPVGAWVHVHNIESQRGRGDLYAKKGVKK